MRIMTIMIIVFVLLLVSIFYQKCVQLYEHFSNGALTQLFAKSPLDSYLTVDTDKYVPEYYIGLVPERVWKYYLWNERPLGDYLHDSHGSIPYTDA